MARTAAYKVTITGFLTYDRKSFDSQHDAVVLLKASKDKPDDLLGKLTAVKVEAKATSFDPDETAQVRRTRGAATGTAGGGAAGRRGG